MASNLRWWLLGALPVALLAVYLHLLHTAFLALNPRAIHHLRGAWGEDNTRSELKRAYGKGLVWGWVDSIDLGSGDLDHVVVTRRGGLLVIDSKWRNQPGGALDMASAARRAGLRAEGVTRSVVVRENGARHRAASNPLRVTPLVALWGAAQHELPEGANAGGVEFVPGRRLVDWLRRLDGDVVDEAAAQDLLTRLENYRAGVRAAADS
jgi:hypothetical protein